MLSKGNGRGNVNEKSSTASRLRGVFVLRLQVDPSTNSWQGEIRNVVSGEVNLISEFGDLQAYLERELEQLASSSTRRPLH